MLLLNVLIPDPLGVELSTSSECFLWSVQPAMRRASALLAAQRRAAELAVGKGVKKSAAKGRGKAAAAAGAAGKARTRVPKEKRSCKIRVLGTARRKYYIDQRV